MSSVAIRWKMLCRCRLECRVSMYLLQLVAWLEDRARCDGRMSEVRGVSKARLMLISRYIGRWSDEIIEWNGRMAPRCTAGRKD